MKTKLLFIKNYLTKFKETWAVLPSSSFLWKKMVLKEDIDIANTIVELWAWTWIFTEEIFKHNLTNKKVFIIEKNKDFYKLLIDKYPKHKDKIYNIDIVDIEILLKKESIDKIDLIISWLPFKSLPQDLFSFIINDLIWKYFTIDSRFIQFSYFKSFKDKFTKYFTDVSVKKCWLNIPPAYIFKCTWFKNNKK